MHPMMHLPVQENPFTACVPSFASAVVTPLSVAANAGLELACYLARTCTFLKSSTSLVTVQPNYCQDPLSKFTKLFKTSSVKKQTMGSKSR